MAYLALVLSSACGIKSFYLSCAVKIRDEIPLTKSNPFMKKLHIVNVVLWLTLALVSCQDLQNFEETVAPVLTEFQTTLPRIDSSIENLTMHDAKTVANIFAEKKAISRSGSPRAIKNVVTINDENGAPAIYAVNFDDGYILVSATKKYFPILAEVDHGTYPNEDMNYTGVEIIIQDMLYNISLARNGLYDFNAKIQWNEYVEKDTVPNSVRSRVTDDYWVAYENWWFDKCEGFNVYYLHECLEKGVLNQEQYDRYVRAVQDEDLWDGTEYSWYWTAYVVERVYSERTQKGPFLTTEWHQGYPYNTTGKKSLGCATIATGQLMNFFRYPSSIVWDNMIGAFPTLELTDFLADLRNKLRVDDDGGTNIEEANRVLTEYGYNTSIISHTQGRAVGSLRNDKPVYARGSSILTPGGHAWVIDGFQENVDAVVYELYRLSDVYYPDFQYVEAQEYDPVYNYSSSTTLHMNWGWAFGVHNGWYLDSDLPVVTDETGSYKFSSNRKDIIINGYK